MRFRSLPKQPKKAAAVAAASGVFSNPVRKNTPQMAPKISQEPTAAVQAGRGHHAPLPRSMAAGRGQHAPLPRPVAAAAATPGPPGAGTLEITMVAAARGARSRVFSNPVRKN